MKGLLYKDAVTLMKQLKLFLMMILIFAVIPGYNLITFALVYCAMLPFSAMAYDERSKWNRLAAMLPYSDAQLVLCKYILGWLSVIGAMLIAAVAQFAVRTRLYEAPHLLGALQIFAILGRQVEVDHVYAHPDIVVVEAVALRRVVDIRGVGSRFAAVVIVSIQSAHHGLVHELEPFLVATCLV